MDFFALASAIGAVSILLTAKVINAIKPNTKFGSYGIAFGVSTILVLVSKFGGEELGLPDVSALSWTQLAFIDVIVFGMAGGFWDALKLFGVRKPK